MKLFVEMTDDEYEGYKDFVKNKDIYEKGVVPDGELKSICTFLQKSGFKLRNVETYRNDTSMTIHQSAFFMNGNKEITIETIFNYREPFESLKKSLGMEEEK